MRPETQRLPETIKLHELRHSAADKQSTGDIVLAQQRLRHESVATTQDYLHPQREDPSDALSRLEVLRSASQSGAVQMGKRTITGVMSSRDGTRRHVSPPPRR